MTDPSSTRARPTLYYPDERRVSFPVKPSFRRRVVRNGVVAAILLLCAGAAAIGVFLCYANRTPREWAAELRREASDQGPIVHSFVTADADWL